MLTFRCRHCGYSLEVADQYSGKAVRCPKCNEQTVAASPGTSTDHVPSSFEQVNRDAPVQLPDLFGDHVGHVIGINFRNPKTIEPVILVRVGLDHFTVRDPKGDLIYHFPFRMVINAVESPQRGTAVVSGKNQFVFVVEVFHLVVYTGGTSIGFSF